MAGPESVPTYPQAEDSPSFPTFKELLFGEAPSREVESKSHGTTLLDTNIVRNTRDLWLNGSGWQEASIECRLGNLILGPGPGLGEVVALYGAAERAWKRRTRELNAREFFEHVLACSDLLATGLSRLKSSREAECREKSRGLRPYWIRWLQAAIFYSTIS